MAFNVDVGGIRLYSPENQPFIWESITRLMDYLHPVIHDGFYYAAVPHWYDESLYVAVRDIDDNRSERIISERLSDYLFVNKLRDHSRRPETTYRLRDIERALFNIYCINQCKSTGSSLYLDIHQRALRFWEQQGDERYGRLERNKNYLYHLLFVDLEAGSQELRRLSEQYAKDRHLSALEKLLETAVEARYYIDLWNDDANTASLSNRLHYYQARLQQMLGKWPESITLLDQINLAEVPELKPYITRARGYASANGEMPVYATAIEQFATALLEFDSLPTTLMGVKERQIETAYTQLALGDANVGLVRAAQTHEERIRPTQSSFAFSFTLIGDFIEFLLSLPLVIYLSRFLGNRVLRPQFWPSLRSLDWVIGSFLLKAVKHYQDGDVILETHSPHEGLDADVQLAFLHLQLGDVLKAQDVFDKLLNQKTLPLSPYRQALLKVGQGEVYLALDQAQRAQEALAAALPILRQHQDAEQVAKATALLGEAAVQSGADAASAIDLFSEALTLHEKLPRSGAVTHITAQLHRLANDSTQPAEQQERAVRVAEQQPAQRFLTRFRHPATIQFRRIASALFFVLGFISVTQFVQIRSVQAGVPDVRFVPARLINAAETFASHLGQGGSDFSVITLAEPDVLFANMVLLFSVYLLVVTLVGLATIRYTTAKRLQNEGTARALTLEDGVLQKGDDEHCQRMRLADVTEVVISDAALVNGRLRDRSNTLLKSPHDELLISGQTVHYDLLKTNILKNIPSSAKVKNINFSFLNSKMGLLFGLTTLFFLLLTLLLTERFASFIATPFLGNYSLADLHTYIYLGVFLPPIWWFFVQPLRQQRATQPRGMLDFWFGGLGLLITFLLVVTKFSYKMTLPNIYPPLAAMILTGAAAWHMLGRLLRPLRAVARPSAGDAGWSGRVVATLTRQTYGRFLFGLFIGFMSLFTFAVMGGYIAREVNISHSIVRANAFRNLAAAASEEGNQETAVKHLQTAVSSYTKAIERSDFEVWGIDFISNQAVPELYANRGAVYLSLATFAVEELATEETTFFAQTPAQTPSAKEAYYRQAIADFDRAILIDDQIGRYYLWNGFIYQALDENDLALAQYKLALAAPINNQIADNVRYQAQLGMGWIYYQDKSLDKAVGAFEAAKIEAETAVTAKTTKTLAPAATRDKKLANAYLGLGYAKYAQAQNAKDADDRDEEREERETWHPLYEAAEGAWQRAAMLDSNDPIAPFNLGILNWRLAKQTGENTCDRYTRSVTHLDDSLKLIRRPGTHKAFTYRTLGQIYWLQGGVRGCVEPRTQAYQAALDSYDRAIALDPDNAWYLQMRGRISYSHWQSMPAGTGPAARVELFNGLRAVDRALEIAPVDGSFNGLSDYRPNWARDNLLYPNAVNGSRSSVARGDAQFLANPPNYAWAFEYYEPVATYLEDDARIAFMTGIAAFANGDGAAARRWYAEGVRRADADDGLTFLLAIGDEFAAARQYEQALVSYETAVSLYQPEANSTVKKENVEALFKIGLMNLALQDFDLAQHAYQNAVRQLRMLQLTEVGQNAAITKAQNGIQTLDVTDTNEAFSKARQRILDALEAAKRS